MVRPALWVVAVGLVVRSLGPMSQLAHALSSLRGGQSWACATHVAYICCVTTAERDQFLVSCPAPTTPPLVDDGDAVGPHGRRQPVCDEHRRTALEQQVQRALDLGFGAEVDAGGGLIEHDHPGPRHERPSQRQ